jgi:hypothetical protein
MGVTHLHGFERQHSNMLGRPVAGIMGNVEASLLLFAGHRSLLAVGHTSKGMSCVLDCSSMGSMRH